MDSATVETPAAPVKRATKKAAPPTRAVVTGTFVKIGTTKRYMKYQNAAPVDSPFVESFHLSKEAAKNLGDPDTIRVTVEAA